MYEEDRQTALQLYNGMFDDAADEVPLIQYFASPTRQAVLVARSYNSTDHKLQVRAESKGENASAQEGTPDFVNTIQNIRAKAEELQLIHPPLDANQISLFEDFAESDPTVSVAEKTVSFDKPADAVSEAAGAFVSETAVSEPPSAESADASDAVDAFLADFSVPDITAPAADPEDAASVSDAAAVPEQPEETEYQPAQADAEEPVSVPDFDKMLNGEEPKTVRKPRVVLLILYTILAVAAGLAGIILLLIPTLLCLALALVTIAVGVQAIMTAFGGGFVVFADIVMILGAALIALALGLLFLWLFIWFIGGAMTGLVRGLAALGSKWCYKEVAAE